MKQSVASLGQVSAKPEKPGVVLDPPKSAQLECPVKVILYARCPYGPLPYPPLLVDSSVLALVLEKSLPFFRSAD